MKLGGNWLYARGAFGTEEPLSLSSVRDSVCEVRRALVQQAFAL